MEVVRPPASQLTHISPQPPSRLLSHAANVSRHRLPCAAAAAVARRHNTASQADAAAPSPPAEQVSASAAPGARGTASLVSSMMRVAAAGKASPRLSSPRLSVTMAPESPTPGRGGPRLSVSVAPDAPQPPKTPARVSVSGAPGAGIDGEACCGDEPDDRSAGGESTLPFTPWTPLAGKAPR